MASLVSKDRFLEIWEANRRLTLKTIEAFPDDQLLGYTPVEPLRSFGAMLLEVAYLELDYMRGIATGEWRYEGGEEAFARRPGAPSRAKLLGVLEEVRAQTRAWWPAIPEDRLLTTEPDPFFGGPPDMLIQRLEYAVENEIHHRAQGYVYLRLLGIEPPAFYDRG